MFVKDWMSKQVLTVGPEESIAHAVHTMKERGIKHLPVLEGGRLVGIISDRDIKEFTPSKATALDIYELHYLLAKAKIRDAMRGDVVAAAPDLPVEEAALLMLEKRIGCLPVLSAGALVGIISDRDIFRALVDISGVRHGGHRVAVTVDDRPGSIREVADIVRRHGFHLQGLLSSYEGVAAGSRRVVLRTDLEGDFEGLRREFEQCCRDVSVRRG